MEKKKIPKLKATRIHNSLNKKRAMLDSLEKSLGVVTSASRASGIPRETHYGWCREDEAYREAVDAISDVALDFAESKLFNNISSGDVASTLFYLKTKGKKRGYIERAEHDLTSGGEKIRSARVLTRDEVKELYRELEENC